MEFIVDVQGFKLPDNEFFIVKDIGILRLQSDKSARPFNFLFQPLCHWTCVSSKYKSINRWLENNLHGITWNSEDLP